MKFKATFARIVNEAQLVEVLIDAGNQEEAEAKFEAKQFQRYLVKKRDLREVTNVGEPTFEKVA